MESAHYEYKGEYLNGKEHGKGKYYCNGNLIYEGEYLNGEKNGKGREYYYSNGKLKYEGEYKNGERHGKGKEYDDNGKLIYEGEYINGKKSGKDFFIELIKRFQRNLAENFKKEGKKVSFELDIRGTKQNLNGAGIEIFFFDENKCSKFMDIKLDHIKNALICFSLCLEIKDEKIIPEIHKFFSWFFDLSKQLFELKFDYSFPFELQFNNNGKNMLISIVCNEEEIIKCLNDLGKNIIEYIKFNFVFKSDINLGEFINNQIDISKIVTYIFSIKTETSNVKVLLENIFRIFKDVKIGNIKIFKFLDLVDLSLESKLKLEYDAKILVDQYENKTIKFDISGKIEPFFKGFYQWFGFDILENINLDDINIILGDQRFLNYYVISIKILGLSKLNEYFSSKYRSDPSFSKSCCMY